MPPDQTPALLPSEPPVNRIFATLRKLWKDQGNDHGEERRFQDLADKLTDHLGIKVTPQKLAQWATASDNRRPPWGAIYWLMNVTGYEVTLTVGGGSGAKLVRPAAGKTEIQPTE